MHSGKGAGVLKIQRTKNAIRNLVSGGILKLLNMVLPFILRSMMLHALGVQYLGLNGLFRSILSFLNLAELGVDSAMMFSMYKPIAEDDTDTICALMKLYRTFYRRIGLFIAVAGIALTPFLRGLISGSIPQGLNLYLLYFMNLGNTVLTYWLFSYKNCLLNAHQRNDVSSRITLVIQIAEYALKYIALVKFRNYYLYLAIQLLKQIAINLCIALWATHMFPQYTPRGCLPREKVHQIVLRVRDLMTAKFSFFIFNSADTLIISAFMGLTALALYQNYLFVIISLRTLLEVAVTACIAGVGNSLITENAEKNYRDFERLSLLYCWLIAICTAMLLCLFQPFMQLWMGQDNLLSFRHIVCFAVYFYLLAIHQFMNMFKDAAGIWRLDRWRPLFGALVNVGLNLATVRWLGLYGILLSSILSIAVIQLPWLIAHLFREVFPGKYLRKYVHTLFLFLLVALASCTGAWKLCSQFQLALWPKLILNAAISFLVPNLLFFSVFGRSPLFKESFFQIKRVFSAHKKPSLF